jgi:hypothetical protein
MRHSLRRRLVGLAAVALGFVAVTATVPANAAPVSNGNVSVSSPVVFKPMDWWWPT